MSTKSTIAYGTNFHFYHEVLDDNHVYLELEGMEYYRHERRRQREVYEAIVKLRAAQRS